MVSLSFAVLANWMACSRMDCQIIYNESAQEYSTDLGPQSIVDFEDFCAIYELGIFKGAFGAEWDVARRKVATDFSNIKLILQRNLDFETGEGDRACGSNIWVDPSNAGNEEVRILEIEDVTEDESRNGRCSVDFYSIPSASSSHVNLEILSPIKNIPPSPVVA